MRVAAMPTALDISDSIDGSSMALTTTKISRADATEPSKPTKAKAKRKRKPTFVWRKRDAQDSQYYNLQLDINDVKQEIQVLTQYRALLYARGLNTKPTQSGLCLRIVDEYLRVFRHGLNPGPPDVDVAAFLHGIMAEDVWINEFRGGIDMVLSQWHVYGACFDHIDLRGIRSTLLPIEDPCGRQGYVVRALGSYRGVVTHNTLAIMFPHVLGFPALASQLIGRELRGRSHYDFVFDSESRRILRCDVSLDFFGSFAKVLPRPQDLSFLFNGAKLESDFYLGEADETLSNGSDDRPFLDLPPKPLELEETSAGSRKMDLGHILS